jgi:hypothetical protein
MGTSNLVIRANSWFLAKASVTYKFINEKFRTENCDFICWSVKSYFCLKLTDYMWDCVGLAPRVVNLGIAWT